MSAVEVVKAAKNPTEALFALAKYIDEQATVSADDHWGAWETDVSPAETAGLADPSNETAIKNLQSKLAEETDPEEIRALEAQLRILRDTGENIETDLADNERSIVGPDGVVDLPPATPKQLAARDMIIEQTDMEEQYGSEIVSSFRKGGPLLMYYTDREWVMQLPDAIKPIMVADIEVNSPAEAHEIGRDILKDRSADGNEELTIDRIARDLDNDNIHTSTLGG